MKNLEDLITTKLFVDKAMYNPFEMYQMVQNNIVTCKEGRYYIPMKDVTEIRVEEYKGYPVVKATHKSGEKVIVSI